MLIYVNHDDIRSLELMEELIVKGFYVSDQLKDLKYADVIYMGMKGVDNKNRLLTNHGTMVLQDDILKSIKKNALVITFLDNEYLRCLAEKIDFRYMSLLNDEQFVVQNSILTAEGLISYLIMHRRYPLYHSHICVLGFGHCAKPIIKYLKVFDADISVIVRNEKYKDEIEQMGCRYVHLNDLDISQSDVLINTIPKIVVEPKHLDNAKKKIMIVDIASYPYGVDHHYALSKGLNSIILPSIPCKYAYGYAGHIIALKIERELENA